MSNNKQSSVEWLYSRVLELTLQLSNKRISQRSCELKILKLFEQAKAMHKVEIIESYASGSNDRLRNTINTNYYNETFGE